MDRIRESFYLWWADISGSLAACLCWFTKDHCDYLTTLTALSIGFFTLFFITIPKALPNIKQFAKWLSRERVRK